MATRKAAPVTAKASPKTKQAAVGKPNRTPNDNWQARADLHTIREAARIQGDKSRMRAVQREAAAHVEALSAIAARK